MAWTILNWLFALLVCGTLAGVIVACIIGDPVEDTTYQIADRDPRPDAVAELLDRLKASFEPRAGNAGTPADISSSAFYPDASSPRSGGGARAGRIGRDGIGEADSSHRGSDIAS